jgi:hypothetical protein
MAHPFRAFGRLVTLAGVALMSMSSASATTVQAGTWRGNGAVLTTTAEQSRIDVGTGLAVIKGPLKTDAKGNFKVMGMFEAYEPGPQRADVAPKMHLAHIQGRVTGTTIALTMHVDGERAMRKYVFTQGRVAKLIRPM